MQGSTVPHLQQQPAALYSSRAATVRTDLPARVLLQQAVGMVLLLAVTEQQLGLGMEQLLAVVMELVLLLLLAGTELRQPPARTGSSSNRSSRVTRRHSSSSTALLLGMVLLLQAVTGSRRMRSRVRMVQGTGSSSSLRSRQCISRSVQLEHQDR
jgi:hypothetical protein